MKNKYGISLILLVITIIVMVILASAIIITLSQNGVIGFADKAVKDMNEAEIYNYAQMVWMDEYVAANGNVNTQMLESKIKLELEKAGVNTDEYEINVTNSGIELEKFNKNDWEFAYTYTQSSNTWSSKVLSADGEPEGDIIVKFYKTGKQVDPQEELVQENYDITEEFGLGDAYKVIVEGSGDMGLLIEKDMSNAYAWQSETLLFLDGYADTCLVPYITDVIIGEGITSIGSNAFMLCESMENITFPASLKKVELDAFESCNNLVNANLHVKTLENWNNVIITGGYDFLASLEVTYDYRTEVEQVANEGWIKAYSSGKTTNKDLQSAVDTYIQNKNIDSKELALYNIKATAKGVEITSKETTLGSIITDGADYGKTINYTANGVDSWQVLYKQTVDGEEYVYLIASENIPNASIPTNLPKTKIKGKNIRWTDPPPDEQAPIERSTLWLAEFGDYKTYENGRVVSYLLSEEYWNAFKNSKYGTNVVGAIGGTTLEMLVKSYNERSAAIGDTVDSELTLSKDTYGYKINDRILIMALSRTDKLYTGSPALEEYTWLASPYYSDDYVVVCVNYGGTVDCYGYHDQKLGLRPLVCLKSNIPANVGLAADDTDIILK